MIICLEGPDGCGKTSVAKAIVQLVGGTVLRLPGGTELGEMLRGMLKSKTGGGKGGEEADIGSWARCCLFMAVDEAGHREAERREGRGEVVVMDRCALSNLAYRRATGEEREEAMVLREVGGMMGAGLWPRGGRLVLLDAPDEVLRERIRAVRGESEDRFDGLAERAAVEYRRIARELGMQRMVVDTTRGGIAWVAAEVLRVVEM